MILFFIGVFGLAVGNLQLDEGDQCLALGGDQGKCVLFSHCTTLGDYKRNRPISCGFKGMEMIVCCPTKIVTSAKELPHLPASPGNIEKPIEQFCKPKEEFSKVLGGTESTPRTHTYMVLIGYKTKKEWGCGGTLITARYVLSAAHCSETSRGYAKWARLGELDYNSETDDAQPVDKTIITRFPHPSYKRGQYNHDIALFMLDSDVAFNDYIFPICLHTKRQITSNFAKVTGWGMTGYNESASSKLLEASVQIYNDTMCMTYSRSLMSSSYDSDQMICAGMPDGSKDTCKGDSGGPLIVDAGNGVMTEIGITSSGEPCGKYNTSSGVYTRVSNYISWIEEVAFGKGNISMVADSSQELIPKEPENCLFVNGIQGICTLRSECQTIGDYKLNHTHFCGYKGFELIVCCPTKMIKTINKVEQFCTQLSHAAQETAFFNKVVGGTPSAPRAHNYMVLIGYGENTKQWLCAGSLINSRYVLSAAHCSNPFTGPAKWARLGELDLNSTSDGAEPIDKIIIERIPYPKYQVGTFYHDIAIFKLDSDVVYNDYIYPVCLHTKREITTIFATIVGWGSTKFMSGRPSNKLLEAEILVYNDTECKRLMFSSNTPQTPRGLIADQMFCAGVPDGSKDACQGDSGGPLVVREIDKIVRTQIGITSFGMGCGKPNLPGVYTRVSNYISWIEEVAFGDGFLLNRILG